MDKTIATIVATVIMSIASVAISDKLWYAALGIFVLTITAGYGYVLQQRSRPAMQSHPSQMPATTSFYQRAVQTLDDIADRAAHQQADIAKRRRTANAVPTVERANAVPIQVSPLQAEAIEVVKLLRNHYKLPVSLNLRSKAAVVQTPINNLVRLTETAPVDANKIDNNAVAIGRFIRKVRNGQGEAVKVRALETQPLYLQYTRQDPQPHLWQDRRWKRRPMTTVIGDYWQGADRHPLTINMFGPGTDHANGLFCGQPGAGKTTILRAAVAGLLDSTGPDDVHIYSIDTKANALSVFTGLPQMKLATADHALVPDVLAQFEAWSTASGKATDGAHRLLIIDEFHTVVSQYGDIIKNIMSQGREHGVRVWACTSVPTRDGYPPTLKMITHFKVAGTVMQDDYLVSELGVRGASGLMPKRECIYSDPSLPNQPVATYWLPDDVLSAEIDRLKQRYGVEQNRGRGGAEVEQKWSSVALLRGRGGAETVGSGAESGAGSGAEVEQTVCTRVIERERVQVAVDFPLDETRTLTDDEAVEVYRMKNEQAMSGNALQVAVFGGVRNSKKRACINDALERAEGLIGGEKTSKAGHNAKR